MYVFRNISPSFVLRFHQLLKQHLFELLNQFCLPVIISAFLVERSTRRIRWKTHVLQTADYKLFAIIKYINTILIFAFKIKLYSILYIFLKKFIKTKVCYSIEKVDGLEQRKKRTNKQKYFRNVFSQFKRKEKYK